MDEKLKILSVTPVVGYFVETNDPEWPDFRRSGNLSVCPGGWEQRMGESWEPVYDDAKIEDEFQKFVKAEVP